jgi:hypothetical protein
VTESTSAIQYLIDLGLPLEQLVQLGGHSVSRTHRRVLHRIYSVENTSLDCRQEPPSAGP